MKSSQGSPASEIPEILFLTESAREIISDLGGEIEEGRKEGGRGKREREEEERFL